MRETVTRDAGQLSIPFVRPERRLPIMIQPIAREGFLGSILPLPCAPSHSFPRFLYPLFPFRESSSGTKAGEKLFIYIFIPAIIPKIMQKSKAN